MTHTNLFLQALSAPDLALLSPSLQTVELDRDDELARAHKPIETVYLPLNCILSAVIVMKDGREIESRTIGRESGFGLLNAIGSRISFERVITQVGGKACRLPVKTLAAAIERSPSLLHAVGRHAQATILQAAQATACNALHDVESRMCRWLLMTEDRLGSSLLPLTQEHLSVMLGVQRTTVTAVAQKLQDAGIVSYMRGKIRVLDRSTLRRRACECYDAIEEGASLMVGDAVHD